MINTYDPIPEASNGQKWVSLGLVVGLHIVLVWGLWNTQIRYAIEQTAPLFVSLIAKTQPKEEPLSEPPAPEPVKP